MLSTDQELLRLQDAVHAARELFVRIIPGIRDPDSLRSARNIWSEAQETLRRHEIRQKVLQSSH
jgi:hypothetical protein